jgi:hypothetical protein
MRLMKSGMMLFVLLALSWLPAAGEIYKCIAEDGAVQYGDKPCAGHATIITPAATPEIDLHAAGRRQRTGRLLRAYDEEQAEEQRVQAEAEAALQKRQRECTRARDWLLQVRQANAIYRVGEDGNRVAMNDAERAAVLAKAEADVARWCD